MYICLSISIRLMIFNCLMTIVYSIATNNRILHNLKTFVNQALEDETSDDLIIEQLSQILEEEEGLRVVNRPERSIDEINTKLFDGSGDVHDDDDENPPPFYSNMSVIEITMGLTTTAFAQYSSHTYPPCRCEKGEQGEKGDAGICPTDCARRYDAYTQDCLGTQINLKSLAQSIRQLIIDTKKIAYRNARTIPCSCPLPSTTTTTISPISTQFTLDYPTYLRLKGEKGDTGTSCSCSQTAQSNIRVFRTIQDALDDSYTYTDHTYIHIVNEYGRLQNVFIRIHGQLIPIKIENENPLFLQQQTILPTTLAIPKPSCPITLTCSRLHIFALGPHVRKMCTPKHSNSYCSKLSEYDDLCNRIIERHNLKGYYRAFMSSSTQWLSNLFAGICVQAQIVNMHEQILFNKVEDIFDQKAPQNEILDVQGLRPQFQYWWHGSYVNGTASSDTCYDWSRHDSSLSGIASRIPDGTKGLFHHRYTWPCSIGDSNMGILCIETNCNREKYYKH